MMEIWKDIEGYEGLYQVSNTGKIKSLSRSMWNGRVWYISKEKIIKPAPAQGGYLDCILRLNYSNHHMRIHRAVALSFIPNPENKPQVNHKDGNKLNNNDWNLEWTTKSENELHAYKMKLKTPNPVKGTDHGRVILTEQNVSDIKTLKSNHTYTELGQMFGVHRTTIYMICKNKSWKHLK